MGESEEMEAMASNIKLLLEKIENIENKLSKEMEKIENRLSCVETKIDTQLKSLTKKVEELEDSQKFINKCFEGHKIQTENLIKKDTLREMAMIELAARVTKLESDLIQEKSERNISEQYHRSSVNVKILGVKLTKDEEDLENDSAAATLEIVKSLVSSAKLTGFDESQIDVCHRLPSMRKDFPPAIIIRFRNKCHKLNFFKQKKLLDSKKIKTNFGVKDNEGIYNKIFMQDSLTQYSSKLLKDAKIAANALNYKYTGYTINGEVRVKLSDGAKYISIKSPLDLKKIK